MSGLTIHLTGFLDRHDVRDIDASIHDGDVVSVARGVMALVSSQGHTVKATGGTYSLDGDTRVLRFEVTGSDLIPMWHVFMRPISPWPVTR